MIIKGNQPSLLQAAVKALAGSDAGFVDASLVEEGKGHGRRERRAIGGSYMVADVWHAAIPRPGGSFPHHR